MNCIGSLPLTHKDCYNRNDYMTLQTASKLIHASTRPFFPHPRRAGLLLLSLAMSLSSGCGGDGPADAPADIYPYSPTVETGRHNVEVLSTEAMVPGPAVVGEAEALNSNNNLDLVRHSDGRVYLAWRTAPDHFAGTETSIHVVSSADEQSWRHEASFSTGTDLREPRLLSFEAGLFLYISELGVERAAFEPMGVYATHLQPDGSWSELSPVPGLAGYIVWRTRVEAGQPYMVAYRGGEHIYLFDGVPLEIELRTTQDGMNWTPVNAERGPVAVGGGSECDFTLGDDGSLFAVIRNEAGDSSGFGSYACRAPASDITDWECHPDPRKFDSPLMFWFDGEAYLVGRRQVTPDGAFDLGGEHPTLEAHALSNQLNYSLSPKRCALWRYLPSENRFGFILDLPSQGDTCFPAVIDGANADEVVLYNYSSPIDGPDPKWIEGQGGETRIYRHVLRFTPSGR